MGVRTLIEAVRQEVAKLHHALLEPVDVAVIDSGVDATHADLAGRIASAVHVRGEGDLAMPVPVVSGSDNDTYGHGTGVASIILRYAPNARIHDIRVLEPGNLGTATCLIRGLEFAIEKRFRVINMSLAVAAEFGPALMALCETAYRQNQVVVASRRNFPYPDEGIPACFSSAIGVGIGRPSSPYSLTYLPDGPIEFGAMGDGIRIAVAGGGYRETTGTSFAAPLVSALCTLYAGAFPELRPYEVKSLLRTLCEE